ncbi:MAG: Asd/ArgC dimerization domain-containing protein, partial [Parvularculaceae bacterium]
IELAVAPMILNLAGPPTVFGISGYSGAGTSPSPRNDPERLKDNVMPYALIGHKHEREASRHLGAQIQFTPHVVPAFRGLIATAHLPLKEPMTAAALKAIYEKAYKDEKLIAIQEGIPELKDGTNRRGALVGGFTVAEDGRRAVVVCAIDNLLKGAAVQAIQNLNLALGLDELMGIAP